MKFSSSLKFNAVAEWWDEYIAYGALKKYIFQLEKQYHEGDPALRDLEASNERSRLIAHGHSSGAGDSGALKAPDRMFLDLLDKQLDKIMTFYKDQEADLAQEIERLDEDVLKKDAEGSSIGGSDYDDDEDDEDDDDDEDDAAKRLRSHRNRTASPSDMRNSTSDYGELGLSVTSQTFPREGTSPEARRRPRRNSKDAAKRPKSALVTLFDRVRRESFSGLSPTTPTENVWNSKSSHARDTRMIFKRKITNIYNQASGLKAYVDLNYSGFRKILKKYDKVLESELQGPYLHNKVEKAYPWHEDVKSKLNAWIATLVGLYAKCVTHGDHATAQKQLRMHEREHIVWERDTVWRQMISQERRGEIGDGQVKAFGDSPSQEKGPALIDFYTRYGRVRINKRWVFFIIATIVFLVLLANPVLDRPEPSNCFAILCFATILWATEAIPLFVTSIFVPFLLAILRVIRSTDGFDNRLTTSQATKFIFSGMFSPTIMLLIGGFTIASALSKTNIDRVLITRVLSFAGTRPSTVLLAFMGVSCFASMWISNVAAPTLCFTLIRPILRTLPPKSSFGPCLILAIALAANIGGQSSPISSPQNLITLQHMDPPVDWLEWFSVALPVSGVSIILIWLFLLLSYRPGTTFDGMPLEIKPIRVSKDKFTWKQYWVVFVCLVTIGLWCIEHSIEEWVGDMGIIAIIPIIAFFSTGVLKKDDFEQFLWSIVFIAMGGSALGKAVEASRLLDAMDEVIRHMIGGLSFYVVVIALSGVVLVISTFISHTIASVLLVPIAAEVGANLPVPHPNLLVFLTGLICSTGMGMPVSGFPNQTAATQTDEVGNLYLTNVDFLKNGVPASIIAATIVATLGFVLMKAIGLQ